MSSERKKVTAPVIQARKMAGPKLVAVTAYDATMARLLDDSGVDIVLVGDSLGMVVQGLDNTLSVTLDEVCYHGRCVARGLRYAHLVGDMPFMSYQVSKRQAVKNAGKMLKEGMFEAVKLEGGVEQAESARAVVHAGIPVMGHVGLTPQSVHAMGGFRVQGRTQEAADKVLSDAKALEDAGVYSIVAEGIPPELCARLRDAVRVPIIGIGAGKDCDGQILVCYDFLGMVSTLRPKFVKRFAEAGELIRSATQRYVAEVQAGEFPAEEHTFRGSVPPPTRTSDGPSYGPSDAS